LTFPNRAVSPVTGEGVVIQMDGQDARVMRPGYLARQSKPISAQRSLRALPLP